jgi:hypothetical protein
LINFVCCKLFFACRFITLPLLNMGRTQGPAPLRYYLDSSSPEYPPTVNQSKELRQALSHAFSKTFLLKPHAVPRSFLEGKSLQRYRDREAYKNASLLYTQPNETPRTDLLDTFSTIHQGWLDYWSSLPIRS